MTPNRPVLSTAVVLRLQKTIGNRAVARLLDPPPPDAAPVAVASELVPVADPVPAPVPGLGRRLATTWKRWVSR